MVIWRTILSPLKVSQAFIIAFGSCAIAVTAQPIAKLENAYLQILIDAHANVVGIIDKTTGKELNALPSPIMMVKKRGKVYNPSSCSYRKRKLTVKFDNPEVTVVARIHIKRRYFVFTVIAVTGEQIDELHFLNLKVTPSKYVSGMSGVAGDDDFAFCLRALNLQVNVRVGGSPALLRATCYQNYGFDGASAVLVGCPANKLRSILKEVVRKGRLPRSPLGGPFALDADENRVSYIFAVVSEENVDEWIKLAKKAGIGMIHLIGWWRTLGHYEPKPSLFPNGLDGLKQVVAKIHSAGLLAGMHTLTGFIAPNDSWVTPIPDKRLAKDATFTLAKPVDETSKVIYITEPPGNLDVVWASHSRGNVIQIDDELIQYRGLSQEPPYGFTNCVRGAFGTKPQAHEQGAHVYHLFSRWAVFFPDETTTLVDELASRIAHVFNTCGFDMIYQDGAEVAHTGWHGVAKMREAIFSKLKGRVRVEASTWNHHSWTFHSCIGAWDHPQWAYKRFTDIHIKNLQAVRISSLLPYQLGWWVIKGPSIHSRGMFPDEMEYFCVKCLAWDAPMSLQGVSIGKHPQNARQDEYLAMLGRYERLRLAGYFSESVKEKLRTPKAEFHLVQADDGVWEFIPMQYITHKVTGLDNGTNTWTLTNQFGPQPIKLRIEALYSCTPYDGKESMVIAQPEDFSVSQTAKGVTCSIRASTEQVKVGNDSACFSARSELTTRRGAWARVTKTFSTPLNMSRYGALGVWIYGDGKGELLNFQLRHPRYYYFADDEHYVDVNFKGWRYFELLLRERDAERYGDYVWPYGTIYSVYRAPLVRSRVSELNIYYNNLPPGDEVRCYISPIKALLAVKVKLTNLCIEVNGKRIIFPVTLESGQYIEFNSPSDCKLYDERGALIAEVIPQGDVPMLMTGENAITFTCQPQEGYSARAEITVICSGEPLRGMAPKEKIKWKLLKDMRR